MFCSRRQAGWDLIVAAMDVLFVLERWSLPDARRPSLYDAATTRSSLAAAATSLGRPLVSRSTLFRVRAKPSPAWGLRGGEKNGTSRFQQRIRHSKHHSRNAPSGAASGNRLAT